MVRVLGLDIGFGICGWAVMQGDRPVEWGIIKTQENTDFLDRTEELENDLIFLLTNYNPDFVGIENPIFKGNKPMNSNATLVVQTLGIIRRCIRKTGYKEHLVYPTQVKASVAKGTANKKEVKEAVGQMFGIPKFKYDDEADAIAIAYCTSQLV